MRRFQAPGSNAEALAFSPDGTKFAVAGNNEKKAGSPGEVTVWELGTGKRLFTRNRQWGTTRHLTFTPDSKALVAVSQAWINVWDSISGKLLRTIRERSPVTALACAPTGDCVAVVSTAVQGKIHVLNWRTGKVVLHLRWLEDFGCAPRFVQFAPDGKQLISILEDDEVCNWDLASKRRISAKAGPELPKRENTFGEDLSKDMRRLATFDRDQNIHLWDARTGKRVWSVSNRPGADGGVHVGLAKFSSDGRWLATAYADSTVEIWDCSKFFR